MTEPEQSEDARRFREDYDRRMEAYRERTRLYHERMNQHLCGKNMMSEEELTRLRELMNE
jgi:hypothetical protein